MGLISPDRTPNRRNSRAAFVDRYGHDFLLLEARNDLPVTTSTHPEAHEGIPRL